MRNVPGELQTGKPPDALSQPDRLASAPAPLPLIEGEVDHGRSAKRPRMRGPIQPPEPRGGNARAQDSPQKVSALSHYSGLGIIL